MSEVKNESGQKNSDYSCRFNENIKNEIINHYKKKRGQAFRLTLNMFALES